MKKIIFEKLIIQNFMSVGDTAVEIDFVNGITFITGYNEDEDSYNGVGKTTIINAFFFALFGTLYGDNSGKLKKADIVNNVAGGSPLVSLMFKVDSDEYEIIRQVSPSKCKIIRNGSEDNQKFSIAESNAEICKAISGDAEVYSNIVVMDSDSKSFFTKEPTKKIKFIENVLGLGIYSDMLKLAKSEFTEKNKELTQETAKLSEITKFKEREVENEKSFESNKQTRVSQKMAQISTQEDKIESLKKESPIDPSSDISALSEELTAVSDRLVKGDTAKYKAESKIKEHNTDIRNIKSKLIDEGALVCPTCKRSFDDHNPEEIKAENEKILEEVKTVEKNREEVQKLYDKIIAGISKLNSKKLELNKRKSSLEENLIEFNNHDSKIKEQEVILNKLSVELESIQNEENPYIKSVKDYSKEEKDKNKLVETLGEEVDVLNYVKYLCSPEGVKAYIISKIVNLFNAKLNSYLLILGSQFKIQFDQFFDPSIKNVKDVEVSYHSLSGGERKRVDLAVLFAFRDIRRLQSNININVTMLDELLDSALCSHGIEKAVTILNESASEHDESIFIITHRRDQIDELPTSRTIELIKQDGITKLLES